MPASIGNPASNYGSAFSLSAAPAGGETSGTRRQALVSTTAGSWRELLAAYKVARDAHDAACEPLAVIEEEQRRFQRTLAEAPPILTVKAKPLSIDDGSGVKIEVPATEYTFRKAADIIAHHKGDIAAAAPMLVALVEYENAQRLLDEQSGWADLQQRQADIDEAIEVASEAQSEAEAAFLNCATTDPEAVAAKIEVLRLAQCPGTGDEPAISALAATLAALPQPSPASSDWNDALAAYEAAKGAYRLALRDHNQLPHSRKYRDVPEPLLARKLHGPGARWHRVADLMDDITVSPKMKTVLAPLVREHEQRISGRMTDEEKALDEALEALDDATFEPERTLLQTPPPDLKALAYKTALVARECDDEKMGFEDLGADLFALHSYYPARGRVQLYQDLLRLAGIDHPVLHLPDFDPSDWILAFKDAGGLAASPSNRFELLLVYPATGATAQLAALRDELVADPIKARAVQLEAERRREEGADPIFDSDGHYGARDGRGHMKGRPAPVVAAGELLSLYRDPADADVDRAEIKLLVAPILQDPPPVLGSDDCFLAWVAEAAKVEATPLDGLSDDEQQTLLDRAGELNALIVETPSATPVAVLAKLAAISDCADERERAVIREALACIEKLAK